MKFKLSILGAVLLATVCSALCFAIIAWNSSQLKRLQEIQGSAIAVAADTTALKSVHSGRKSIVEDIVRLQMNCGDRQMLEILSNARFAAESLGTAAEAPLQLVESLAKMHQLSSQRIAVHAFTIQLTAAIWLAILILTGFGAWILWHQHVEKPLQNISCMLTIAQEDFAEKGDFLDIKTPESAENAVRKFLALPEQSSRNTFLAEMSHEIKTPLNGLIGFISNLNDTPLNRQQKQFLKIIDSSANSLLHVINQILDFSKLNAGSLELENVAFDLKALAQDRITIAGQLAKAKKLKTTLVFPTDGDVIVRGDPNRLRQVLDNLLNNAVKFTNAGEICLEINMQQGQEGQNTFQFAVRDTGIGISPEKTHNLFKPFKQADSSISRRYGGSGLGLCISSSIVKLMGGTLDVRSKSGEGSTFFFSINLKTAKPEEQIRLTGPYSISLPQAELKKRFALLVDDTPTNLFLLETVCQTAGLPYLTAQNGQEAVELCSSNKFDIIFMDIQMPVMDGYTAIRKIRQLPNTAMTHIVALTASAFQEDVDRALGAGSTEYLPKPFEKNQLLLTIADALAITPQKVYLPQEDRLESPEEETIRQMHDFMREQYQLSLSEIKMTLAQTVADWRPLLDNLCAYAKSGNYEQARAILHKLKGQLASIGLPEQSQAAALINDSMRNNPNDPLILTKIYALVAALTRIFKALEQEVTVFEP